MPCGRARLAEYLKQRFGSGADSVRVTPLAGDASTREYYRVSRGAESWVAALYPESLAAAQATYLTLHALLVEWGVPVPSIVESDAQRGVVLLEDLGDCTLQQRLALASAEERTALYRQAMDQIIGLQRAAARAPTDAACFHVAFDAEKLSWELQFFVEHYLEGLKRRRLTAEERDALAQGFGELCQEIASWPRVLCHRDYHSRNLMWRAGALRWVDFQDARMGPVTYDVASLLRDSYAENDEEFVAARLLEFRRGAGLDESTASLERRFELTCVQRNLKALGTFGYMATVRGKPEYLGHVPRTWAYARRNLRRHRWLAGVARVLERHLEEP